MDKNTQIKRAREFMVLHGGPKLLVLPNVWDPLGARLLESLGYPAVATASASVAYSLGFDDGQKISFAAMLDVIGRIASCVDVPVSADIENGYAESPDELAENIREVLRVGAVGINLEDSMVEGGALRPLGSQCSRIQAARSVANQEGIPLVISVRIDVFLRRSPASTSEKLDETIARANAYCKAGADCIYPITVGDLETLKVIRQKTEAPINVHVTQSTASMKKLEAIGISRLSLGPGLIKASLTAMKHVAQTLQNYGSYDFTRNAISGEEIGQIVSSDKML